MKFNFLGFDSLGIILSFPNIRCIEFVKRKIENLGSFPSIHQLARFSRFQWLFELSAHLIDRPRRDWLLTREKCFENVILPDYFLDFNSDCPFEWIGVCFGRIPTLKMDRHRHTDTPTHGQKEKKNPIFKWMKWKKRNERKWLLWRIEAGT